MRYALPDWRNIRKENIENRKHKKRLQDRPEISKNRPLVSNLKVSCDHFAQYCAILHIEIPSHNLLYYNSLLLLYTSIVVRKKSIVLIRNAQAYDFGGGERFPVFVAKILQKNNLSPVVVSRSPKLLAYAKTQAISTVRGLWWSKQNWSGTHVLLLPVYILWQTVLFIWYTSLFIRLRPTAVHIQSKDDFIAATYAARLIGATVVWTDHADLKHIWRNLNIWYKNPIGHWIYRTARLAQAITVVSESEYDEVMAHLPAASKVRDAIQVVYNGSSDQLADYPSPPSETFTFCSINRLVTDKGIGEMIAAYKHLHAEHPDTSLILVGNGPEEKAFEHLAADDSSIVFVGYRPDPLVYVAQSQVFLQPTYHEGFSVALVEASMMRKPIIATSVGGNVEIIKDGETGLLIPARDADALYAAMSRLYDDRALGEKLSSGARSQYLNKFVFDKIVKERFMKLYGKTAN